MGSSSFGWAWLNVVNINNIMWARPQTLFISHISSSKSWHVCESRANLQKVDHIASQIKDPGHDGVTALCYEQLPHCRKHTTRTSLLAITPEKDKHAQNREVSLLKQKD